MSISARSRYLLFLASALLGALVFLLQHRPPSLAAKPNNRNVAKSKLKARPTESQEASQPGPANGPDDPKPNFD